MTIARRVVLHALAVGLFLAPAVALAQAPVSTGTLAPGALDLAWQVSVNSGAFGSAFVLSRAGGSFGSYGWSGASASGMLPGGIGAPNASLFAYSYQTMFTGGGITSATFQCAFDDALVSITLNGVAAVGSGCSPYDLGATYTVSVFNEGVNTLRFNTTGNSVTDGLIVRVADVTGVTGAPEPTTFMLLATGHVSVFGVAHRKRNSRSAA